MLAQAVDVWDEVAVVADDRGTEVEILAQAVDVWDRRRCRDKYTGCAACVTLSPAI